MPLVSFVMRSVRVLPTKPRQRHLWLVSLIVAAVVASCSSIPPGSLPETQIWMADFDIRTGAVTDAQMIIDAPGYDNQPMFTDDGAGLLFVSNRDGESQTDVYRYDLLTRDIKRLTSTPQQEFSPTPIPGSSNFSVVRVEEPDMPGNAYTESQQLWQYTASGQPIAAVIQQRRVGYHLWLDSSSIALFIVGDELRAIPNRLEVHKRGSSEVDPIANSIGRCFRRHPNGQLSYVDVSDSTAYRLMLTYGPPASPEPLVTMPEGAQDYCWLWDGSALIMTSRGTIYRWTRGIGDGLQPLIALSLGGNGARIVANPSCTKIAWVVVKPGARL